MAANSNNSSNLETGATVVVQQRWLPSLAVGLAMMSVGFSGVTANAQLSGIDTSLPAKADAASVAAKPKAMKKVSKQPMVQFKNAELMEVAQVLTRISDRRFIFEGSIKGKTTILSSSAITSEDLYKAFLNALALNGYSVDESNGFIRVYAARNVARGNHDFIDNPTQMEQEKVVSWVYKLNHMQAADFAREYSDIVSREGEMNVNSANNTVVFTDFSSSLKRVQKMLAQIDVSQTPAAPAAVEQPEAEKPVAIESAAAAAPIAVPLADPKKPEEFKAVEESKPAVPAEKADDKFEVREIVKDQAPANLEQPREMKAADALAEDLPSPSETTDLKKLDVVRPSTQSGSVLAPAGSSGQLP